MYCRECGVELPDGAQFCGKCGAPQYQQQPTQQSTTQSYNTSQYQQQPQKSGIINNNPYQNQPQQSGIIGSDQLDMMPYNRLAVAGFIVSIASLFVSIYGIVPIAGIVLSIIGLVQLQKTGERGRVLAIIGICLGVLVIIYMVYIFTVVGTVAMMALSTYV